MGSSMDKRSQQRSLSQAQQYYQQQQMFYPQQNYATQSKLTNSNHRILFSFLI